MTAYRRHRWGQPDVVQRGFAVWAAGHYLSRAGFRLGTAALPFGASLFGARAKSFSGAFTFLFASFGLYVPVAAQDAINPVDPGKSSVEQRLDKVDKNKPMLLQADELIYDNRHNRVLAQGNVEIYFNNYTLTAKEIIYDREKNTLQARGAVRIKEPDGAIIQAEEINLSDDFKAGFIGQLSAVTEDNWRIAANKANRVDENTTVFENAVATPCKACKDPTKAPAWRVKATRVIHDKVNKTISYKNATFELFGAPIAWLPYFSHADPTVKRKSGFLIPHATYSSDLGFMVETPYFFALAPNYDVTFSPLYMTKQGLLAKGEWRHRTSTGAYNIQLAGINQANPIEDDDPITNQPGDTRFRGSIKTEGDFKINEIWNWGWDITASSDDTFRRFYKIDNVRSTDRVSQAHITAIDNRSYFSLRGYQFGSLLLREGPLADARVRPVIDFNHVFSDPLFGGELSLNMNALSLTRNEDETETHRLVADVGWRRTFIDGLGQAYTPFFKARGDLYEMRNVVDFATGAPLDERSETRAIGVAGLEYRFPFVAYSANASHVLEPIGQVITRTRLENQDNFTNEDAQSLVFDDTLLFDHDKFSGYDRIETGTRVNAGLQYSAHLNTGGFIRAVAGQSFHISGDNPFVANSGLDTDKSDYVAGIMVSPSKNFQFVAQTRFDQNDLTVRRVDVGASAITGPLTSSLNYAKQGAIPALGFDEPREEIIGRASIQLAENWFTFGSVRYDLQNHLLLSDSVGIKYADECFVLSVAYNQKFFSDRDIDPNETIVLKFEMKHLGGAQIKTDAIGSSSE